MSPIVVGLGAGASLAAGGCASGDVLIFSIEDKNCDNRKFMLWLCV